MKDKKKDEKKKKRMTQRSRFALFKPDVKDWI